VRLGAYDFQDVVNYILYQVSFFGYRGVPLHFMMIDEVQDLTHSTLMLLLRVTEQNLFFSGDTA
jgi:ATP-dependent exoDNAse (exonuclease V) beta subunit